MSKILAIDASSEACSVALLNGSDITDKYQIAPREHAKLLLPMVEELLAQSQLSLSQLDAIACHVGPGAFTGIRIAVSVAQGLAYGVNIATIGLSSLANLAINGYNKNAKKQWLCAIDARMSEVYFAGYQMTQQGSIELISPEIVVAPNVIDFSQLKQQFDFSQVGLIGSGWEVYADQMFCHGLQESQFIANAYPSAKYGLKQAEEYLNQGITLKPEALQPVYLRNNVAKKSKKAASSL